MAHHSIKREKEGAMVTIELTVCPVCGRTDRFAPLKKIHFIHGSRCPGVPEKWVYGPSHRKGD